MLQLIGTNEYAREGWVILFSLAVGLGLFGKRVLCFKIITTYMYRFSIIIFTWLFVLNVDA